MEAGLCVYMAVSILLTWQNLSTEHTTERFHDSWAQDPFEPWDPLGPGPIWARDLFGSRTHFKMIWARDLFGPPFGLIWAWDPLANLGPGPIWNNI
jgi:hypothetical protein